MSPSDSDVNGVMPFIHGGAIDYIRMSLSPSFTTIRKELSEKRRLLLESAT
ncbi:MAG: hypothetical protein IJJ77_02280 [Paludibacteraceae bacterium]|nr:hypothetical protein [Paludibacteraceae bacterium]